MPFLENLFEYAYNLLVKIVLEKWVEVTSKLGANSHLGATWLLVIGYSLLEADNHKSQINSKIKSIYMLKSISLMKRNIFTI